MQLDITRNLNFDFYPYTPFGLLARIALVGMRKGDTYAVLYPLYIELINRGHQVWVGWADEFERFPHRHVFDVAVFTDHQYTPQVKAKKNIVVGHGLMVSKNYTFTYTGESAKKSITGSQSEFDRYTRGNGYQFVDHIVTVSEYSHKQYLSRGVPEEKLAPLGYLETDWLFRSSYDDTFYYSWTLVAPTWNLEFRGYLDYLSELIRTHKPVVLKRHPNDPYVYKNLSPTYPIGLVDPCISLVSLLQQTRLVVTDVSSAMFLALLKPEIPVWLYNSPLREKAGQWWYDPEGMEHKVRDFGQEFSDILPEVLDTPEKLKKRVELSKCIYADLVDGNVSVRVADLVESCL